MHDNPQAETKTKKSWRCVRTSCLKKKDQKKNREQSEEKCYKKMF